MVAFVSYSQASHTYPVKAFLILDSEGGRILCKYYSDDWPTLAEQTEFEQELFDKTFNANGAF